MNESEHFIEGEGVEGKLVEVVEHEGQVKGSEGGEQTVEDVTKGVEGMGRVVEGEELQEQVKVERVFGGV